jgi:cyclopropane-fatty-acyl-phospholipid synthase
VLYGNVGFGESYMHGEWESPDLSAVVSWLIRNVHDQQGERASSFHLPGLNLLRAWNLVLHWMRPNSLRTSRRNIAEHYDLGNAFYRLWLDEGMAYSAAKFSSGSQSLEQAQEAKYEALCQKLHLQPEQELLEIGCGWGGFAVHAARHHGVRVKGVTISQEQYDFAVARVRREGLEDRIEIALEDYRLIQGRFDRIASIEMLEAVGDAFVDGYFAKVNELLKPDGVLAIQVITVPDLRYERLRRGVDWIQRHIFPGSLLMSQARLNQAMQRAGDFNLISLEDMASGYARTLNLWQQRFEAALPQVRELGFDEVFIRKWNYYLKYCEAAFATRNISVIQAAYTRSNNAALHSGGGWSS